MSEIAGLKKTPLHDIHLSLGARMAPFGGYSMPIQYSGIVKEHHAARKGAAIFDTCHMGQFQIAGKRAVADIEGLVTCHVAAIELGQCRYALMCNESGGVVDDLLIYRLGDKEFLLVVNAGTRQRDFEWIKTRLSAGTTIGNLFDFPAKIDLQGPKAPGIMRNLLKEPIDGLKYYHFAWNVYDGKKTLVSRTGYTGEIGFEFYSDAESAARFWNDCLEAGAEPAGLGARDTLRLEMGMPLYGNELDETRNAAQSGFSRAIASDKRFVGSDVVLDESGTTSLLVGMEFESRETARKGDRILDESGAAIGIVTSGSFAPSLDKAVALGYVKKLYAAVGTRLIAAAARRNLECAVAPLPFYKYGTARKPIADFLNK